jgi:hypothetical protein
MRANTKDVASGLIFIGIGIFFGASVLLGGLRVGGGSFGIGPGLFPLAISALLCGLGAVIAISALGQPVNPLGPVAWRGLLMVTLAILFFAFTLDPLGLAPAVFGCVLLAAASTTRSTLKGSLLTSLVLTVFSVAIFIYALGLNIKAFGPWLGG